MRLSPLAMVAVCCTMSPPIAARQVAVPPAAQDGSISALPKAGREALERRWKTATIAAVDSQASACQNAAPASPIVSADFDSDTLVDYALAVQAPDGVKLVVLLRRGEEYRVEELDQLGAGPATAFLGLEKRGTRFLNAATSTDDFFSADTLAAHRCGAPTVVYLWAGSGFRRVTVAQK